MPGARRQPRTVLLTPRYWGKTSRILAIHRAFRDEPGVGLHPQQIARHTGISMIEVKERLDATPELFVRLPRRDGLTRYRLTSTTSAEDPDAVEARVRRHATREAYIVTAVSAMVLCGFVIIALLMSQTSHGSTLPATGDAPPLPHTSAVGEAPPAEGSVADTCRNH